MLDIITYFVVESSP